MKEKIPKIEIRWKIKKLNANDVEKLFFLCVKGFNDDVLEGMNRGIWTTPSQGLVLTHNFTHSLRISDHSLLIVAA